jgi:diadenosine tetraphosphate (Ap4A) HIT family hydrolase
VHFHIIPKFGSEGLGIHWPAQKLGESTARQLLDRMRKALDDEAR